MDDMWDPNTWGQETNEFRIYSSLNRPLNSDEDLDTYAIVDEVDYGWACQWGWSKLWSRGKRRFYLRRAVTIPTGADWKDERTGKRVQNRRTENLFLHVAIMERMGIPQPTPKHRVGHADDEALNCRRENLAWVTHAQNVRAMIIAGKHRGFHNGAGKPKYQIQALRKLTPQSPE